MRCSRIGTILYDTIGEKQAVFLTPVLNRPQSPGTQQNLRDIQGYQNITRTPSESESAKGMEMIEVRFGLTSKENVAEEKVMVTSTTRSKVPMIRV
jgi:hypothetical protein